MDQAVTAILLYMEGEKQQRNGSDCADARPGCEDAQSDQFLCGFFSQDTKRLSLDLAQAITIIWMTSLLTFSRYDKNVSGSKFIQNSMSAKGLSENSFCPSLMS